MRSFIAEDYLQMCVLLFIYKRCAHRKILTISVYKPKMHIYIICRATRGCVSWNCSVYWKHNALRMDICENANLAFCWFEHLVTSTECYMIYYYIVYIINYTCTFCAMINFKSTFYCLHNTLQTLFTFLPVISFLLTIIMKL